MSLIIHAPNVHQGGGKTLLAELLRGIDDSYSCTLLADARLDLKFVPKNTRILSFAPTLWGRLGAERCLNKQAHPQDTVLCMGNLPPLLPCAGRVTVFLQNRYLLGDVPLEGMPNKTRVRIGVESAWLRWRLLRGMELFVQTASMHLAAKKALGVEPILRLPCRHLGGIGSRPAPRAGHGNPKPALIADFLAGIGVCRRLAIAVLGHQFPSRIKPGGSLAPPAPPLAR